MSGLRLLRRFLRDENATTAIEFAVVAVMFFTMMFGIIEYGLIMMTKIAIESATQQVSRSSGVNKAVSGCLTRSCQVQVLVQQKTMGLINPAYVLVTSRVISAPTDASPPVPDVCTVTPGVPSPATCASWINNDGVPGYQQAGALTNAAVGAENELVEIRVSYTWQVMFPLMKPFFPGGVVNMSSSTVVKDEPFGP